MTIHERKIQFAKKFFRKKTRKQIITFNGGGGGEGNVFILIVIINTNTLFIKPAELVSITAVYTCSNHCAVNG
jgi:hypothetical protein